MKEIANRIPKRYVVVAGSGQSNFGPGTDPWETASYDLALCDAGIENCNIVKYTSVIPPEAKEITLEQAELKRLLHHGMVLECIMAQQNGNQGEHICAGVGRANVYRTVEYVPGTFKRELIGGFAAEYEGHGSVRLAEKRLEQALHGIFERRYRKDDSYELDDLKFATKDLVIDDDYGTVLVALGFVTYLIPIVK